MSIDMSFQAVRPCNSLPPLPSKRRDMETKAARPASRRP